MSRTGCSTSFLRSLKFLSPGLKKRELQSKHNHYGFTCIYGYGFSGSYRAHRAENSWDLPSYEAKYKLKTLDPHYEVVSVMQITDNKEKVTYKAIVKITNNFTFDGDGNHPSKYKIELPTYFCWGLIRFPVPPCLLNSRANQAAESAFFQIITIIDKQTSVGFSQVWF